MNNDILGIPSGVLTWWKPSQYNETYDTQSLKEYFKCPKGEARSLVPRIHSIKQGLPLTDISIETHESNKIDFVTLTYSATREEPPDRTIRIILMTHF